MPPIVAEIEQLRNRILEMGGLVEAALGNGICSLRERTQVPARGILASEPRIHHLEMLIDESATRLPALHQPVAGDLRFVTAALKINKDLERMGDLAENIAERALSFISRGFDIALDDISESSKAAQSMVRQSLDAFVGWDQTLARKFIAADDFVDDLKHTVYHRLVRGIDARDVRSTSRCPV